MKTKYLHPNQSKPTENSLKSYKSDGNTTWGRSNAIMGGVAKQFSNAELKELANYIGRQPGELQVVPQAKFR